MLQDGFMARQLFDFWVEVVLYLLMKICPLTDFLILQNKSLENKFYLAQFSLVSFPKAPSPGKQKHPWKKQGTAFPRGAIPFILL